MNLTPEEIALIAYALGWYYSAVKAGQAPGFKADFATISDLLIKLAATRDAGGERSSSPPPPDRGAND